MLQVELKALFGLCYMRGIQGANLQDAKVSSGPVAIFFIFL